MMMGFRFAVCGRQSLKASQSKKKVVGNLKVHLAR